MLHKQRGFTLIELAVTLAILGVALTLATASWQRASDRHVLTGGARQVVAFIATAQSDAIQRNQDLSVVYSRTDASQWCLGATAGSAGCDCTETDPAQADFCAVDGAPRRLAGADVGSFQLLAASDLQPDGGDGRIVFNPVMGILDPTGDELVLAFASQTGNYQLTVSAGPTGLIATCQPAASEVIVDFPDCAP